MCSTYLREFVYDPYTTRPHLSLPFNLLLFSFRFDAAVVYSGIARKTEQMQIQVFRCICIWDERYKMVLKQQIRLHIQKLNCFKQAELVV